MTPFDSFCVVDWSSGNDSGPSPRKDAIWAAAITAGKAAEPVYMRNRIAAFEWLVALIKDALTSGRRLLLGFDFPFGYPAGFARCIIGSENPMALWNYYAERLVDTPTGNTRFDLAGEINSTFPGVGPFWFNALKRDIPHLPRKGRDRRDHGMRERREIEERLKGAFTVWQMGGAGAVGGQVMTGLAMLSQLRARFPGQISAWPFEPDTTLVRLVEIWPTLIDPVVNAQRDMIRDSAQVLCLARALSRLPPDILAKMFDVDAPEEGWILGTGFEEELQAHAWPT